MNWEDIGMMVGYNLANGYFKHQHDGWVDEGRKALEDMANVSDADRKNARGFLQGAIDRNGIIGQDPSLLYLKRKQGYMQALNDKQYLLDNGYAADSKEVKEFDAKMAKAHKEADELRAYAKSAGFDFGGLGDGMNLQQLNHEVTIREYPAFNPSNYNLLNAANPNNGLWSDMGAGYVLGKTDTPPSFNGSPQGQVAAMNAAGAPQQAALSAATGTPQPFGMTGLAKPASELSSEELSQLLGTTPSYKDDPFGLRGANQGNAFSLGADKAFANQGARNATGADGTQTAQDGAGATEAADANIDMGQTVNAPINDSGANGGYPYPRMRTGASKIPNEITAESIYKYLQSIGQINKNVDYDAAIDDLAKGFAEERVKRMTDSEKREYLVSHGIGNDIASIVIPEANAKARDKARKEAVAKMAASATNPMMAQAIALMSLTDGAKPSDFMDAVHSTKPEMGFNDLDLGGTKMRTMYDKNGWIKPEAAQFIKTLSPNEIVVSRDKAAGRQLQAKIADARNQKDLAVAGMTNKTRYATTKMQQEGANWREQYRQSNENARMQYRSQHGGSGGRAAGGKGGEKLTQAQQHFLNEFSNRYLAAKQAITDGYSEDDHGLQELTDFLYDDGRKMLSPEDFRKFEAYVYALQGYMWKQHAIDDPTDENAENQAMEHWRHVPPEILEEEFPGYNFDAYK